LKCDGEESPVPAKTGVRRIAARGDIIATAMPCVGSGRYGSIDSRMMIPGSGQGSWRLGDAKLKSLIDKTPCAGGTIRFQDKDEIEFHLVGGST
jgi:hypothetical protein